MSYLVANSEDRVSHDEAHILQSHFKRLCYFTIEPRHDKKKQKKKKKKKKQSDCAPSEDSDQPGHPPSLIRVFAVHSTGS